MAPRFYLRYWKTGELLSNTGYMEKHIWGGEIISSSLEILNLESPQKYTSRNENRESLEFLLELGPCQISDIPY